jgi:hypothetical protein
MDPPDSKHEVVDAASSVLNAGNQGPTDPYHLHFQVSSSLFVCVMPGAVIARWCSRGFTHGGGIAAKSLLFGDRCQQSDSIPLALHSADDAG